MKKNQKKNFHKYNIEFLKKFVIFNVVKLVR